MKFFTWLCVVWHWFWDDIPAEGFAGRSEKTEDETVVPAEIAVDWDSYKPEDSPEVEQYPVDLPEKFGALFPKSVVVDNVLEDSVCAYCFDPKCFGSCLAQRQESGGRINSSNWSSLISSVGKPTLKASGWKSLNEPSESWGEAKHPSYRDMAEAAEAPFVYRNADKPPVSDPLVVDEDCLPKYFFLDPAVKKTRKKPAKKSPAKSKKKTVKKGKPRAAQR